jgi:hypothetical protein
MIHLKKYLRVLYGFLRALYVFLRLIYDAYGLLQVIYELFTEKRDPLTIGEKFLTCQKICPNFHGSLRVCASYKEL